MKLSNKILRGLISQQVYMFYITYYYVCWAVPPYLNQAIESGVNADLLLHIIVMAEAAAQVHPEVATFELRDCFCDGPVSWFSQLKTIFP